jgi:Rieske 2Fe-2S family protein
LHASDSPLAGLIESWTPGHTLPQGFYEREAVFALDLDLLLGRWHCAGHISDVAKAGDYLLCDVGRESAIVVRGGDGEVRALANVCRHRGSRVCIRARGHAAALTCPYHAWSYHLDGRLRHAREMPDGFNPDAHGLPHLQLEIIGGLIFVSFGGTPPLLTAASAAIAPMAAQYGWETARVAARKTYSVAANWKLVLENYHECYHCGPAHPEFSALHALARPNHRAITGRDAESWAAAPGGQEMFRVMHSALADGARTGSRDGQLLAPLMAETVADRECVFAEVGFLSAVLAYPDYGVIYRFMPRGVFHTDMEVLWLVRGDAVAGRDYDPDALMWLWDVTSQADKTIIERNQAGVSSRAYRPGPFSLMEPGTRQFVERYLGEMALLERS